MEPGMCCTAVINANFMLAWLVQGLMFGLGFALAFYLVGIPFKRWVP